MCLSWWRFSCCLLALAFGCSFRLVLVRSCACLWCWWVFGRLRCFSWLWCVVFGVFLFGAFGFGVWYAVFGSFSCVFRGVLCFRGCLLVFGGLMPLKRLKMRYIKKTIKKRALIVARSLFKMFY